MSGARLDIAVHSEAGGALQKPGGGPDAGVGDREVLARPGRLVLLLIKAPAGGHSNARLLGGGDLGVISIWRRGATNIIVESLYPCFSKHLNSEVMKEVLEEVTGVDQEQIRT